MVIHPPIFFCTLHFCITRPEPRDPATAAGSSDTHMQASRASKSTIYVERSANLAFQHHQRLVLCYPLRTVGRGGTWRGAAVQGLASLLRNASDQFLNCSIQEQIFGLHFTESATDMNSAGVGIGVASQETNISSIDGRSIVKSGAEAIKRLCHTKLRIFRIWWRTFSVPGAMPHRPPPLLQHR
jgi:hypothetical protein